MGLNHPLKNTFWKNCLIVIATTGASNNFDIEKLYFLRGLDTPYPPALKKGASREKNFEQLSPKVEKSEILRSPFFHSSQKCIFPSKIETLIAGTFLPSRTF